MFEDFSLIMADRSRHVSYDFKYLFLSLDKKQSEKLRQSLDSGSHRSLRLRKMITRAIGISIFSGRQVICVIFGEGLLFRKGF